MSTYRWLKRRIAAPGPYLALCLTEQEFHHALRAIKVHARPDFVSPKADATTHFIVSDTGDITCIVCVKAPINRDPIEVAGLLVHEAVHIWQEYCAMINEKSPGSEQEAYAIQAISQELMSEYARRMTNE